MPLSESKPGINQLLIASALDADLLRELLERPDEVFSRFDLTEEEKALLRQPDHRLLRVLGAALAEEQTTSRSSPVVPLQPHAVFEAQALPDVFLGLTLVPCARYENGRLSAISYAVWVNPLAPGADPASLPPPQGAAFPGQPLTPLHAVIQVSTLRLQDAAGIPQIGLTAYFRQSSNLTAPAPPDSAGRPDGSPFGNDHRSDRVQTAVAAVREALPDQKYDRLIDLLGVLRRSTAATT
jgi:hypothetical protein